MADIIQRLPEHVANQIAAGEVVQRPASVVKELLENAIDAKSVSVKLNVKDGGKTLIQVIDNGCGMSETDACLSFERHATSKIRFAEDLFQLQTKGFRGEALASIAAIAHVDLQTKLTDEDVGTQIKIQGGKLISQDITACPSGTSVAVKNLFFNIPARRNFLKSDQVELRHIIDEFQRVALAHPEIHLEMHHNNNELFNLPVSNLRQRIVKVFGAKINERLVPVEEHTEVLQISGFIGKPAFAKKSRGEQFFFVNNRFVKSSYLHHAVVSAFEGLIKERTYPSYFLYFQVDPNSIDINIHPTKTEIKFDDEHTLYALIRSCVKHSLGQFSISPTLDFERDSNLDTPYAFKEREAKIPTIEVDADFNPFKEEQKSVRTNSGGAYFKKESTPAWESLYSGLKDDDHKEIPYGAIEVESEEVSGMLFQDPNTPIAAGSFQIHKKYILTTIKSGIVIIDQNKAHQRILYEQFLKNITLKEAVSQQLLFPLTLSFSKNEINIIRELSESLTQTGFIFTAIEEESLIINGLPMKMDESEVPAVLEQLLTDFREGIPDSDFSQVDYLARTLSKTLAIKNGAYLDMTSQEALVNNLFACKEPELSPFNKSTYSTITVEELDKRFF